MFLITIYYFYLEIISKKALIVIFVRPIKDVIEVEIKSFTAITEFTALQNIFDTDCAVCAVVRRAEMRIPKCGAVVRAGFTREK